MDRRRRLAGRADRRGPNRRRVGRTVLIVLAVVVVVSLIAIVTCVVYLAAVWPDFP